MAKSKSARKSGTAAKKKAAKAAVAPSKKASKSAPKAAPKKALKKATPKAKAKPAKPAKAKARATSAKAPAKKAKAKAASPKKGAAKKSTSRTSPAQKAAPKREAQKLNGAPAKHVSPSLPLASPTPTAETSVHVALAPSDVELLLDLRDDFARPLDRPVSDVVEEARELETAVASRVGRLVTGTRVERETVDSIGARTNRLIAAELAWNVVRASRLPESLRPILEEALAFERDAIAALRYFCDHDEDVQRRIDGLGFGAGIGAMTESLRVLSDLLNANGSALKHADLPNRPGSHARELAHAFVDLANGAVDERPSSDVRNRAFWHLREAMDAIRSAARYTLRAEPASLPFFRPSPQRAPVSKPTHA